MEFTERKDVHKVLDSSEGMHEVHKGILEKELDGLSNYIPCSNKSSEISIPKQNMLTRPNFAFACYYCDGGSSECCVGYMGVCSEKQIQHNIEVAQYGWCSDPDCLCYQFLYGQIDMHQLEKLYRDGNFVCCESQMLKEWAACTAYALDSDQVGEAERKHNDPQSRLAVLTTIKPGTTEEDRIVFAVFLADTNKETENVTEGYLKANSEYRIKLSLTEATQIKFWNYCNGGNGNEKCEWSGSWSRCISDIEAAQILRDITAVKCDPAEKTLAEELLVHFCNTKKIRLNELPAPNGVLKR